jgi:DNA polymerase III alpha subunit
MKRDKYGNMVYTEIDICKMYMENRDRVFKYALVDKEIKFDPELELTRLPTLIEYISDDSLSVEEFDRLAQSNWLMPQEYKDLDIVLWVLNQCTTDEQRQRVGEELILYVERDLIPLLQYMKYLTDTMRSNNIVWGVGRGSSVASYVLYLIGVHRIDSMYYDLDIKEFLK